MNEMRTLAADWTKKLNIRALSSDFRVIGLSGGNQQKVVIAKALVQKPRLIIFDEPTRGVDVGAIAEINHLISALADEGLAVVVISSYLPEILSCPTASSFPGRVVLSKNFRRMGLRRNQSCLPRSISLLQSRSFTDGLASGAFPNLGRTRT